MSLSADGKFAVAGGLAGQSMDDTLKFWDVAAGKELTGLACGDDLGFKADRLIHVVGRALEAARLKREVQELKLKAGDETELVGVSSAVSQIRQAVEKIAPTNSRVFITGPSGSGKELLARLIHARSRRAANAFVAVNCATMEADRIETELFGVRKSRRHAQDRSFGIGA